MLSSSTCLALLAIAAPALAQLSTFRTTIPGSLHQCESTNMYFFQTGASRPLSVLFLPSDKVPASLKTGTTTLEEAIQYEPLLALTDITTGDAQQYDFSLQIAAGQSFEVFAFLPDGTGKNMNLARTVQAPLPGASNCLRNVPTTIPGVGAAAGAASGGGSSRGTSAASREGQESGSDENTADDAEEEENSSSSSSRRSTSSAARSSTSSARSTRSGTATSSGAANRQTSTAARTGTNATNSTSAATGNKTPIALLSVALGFVAITFVGLF